MGRPPVLLADDHLILREKVARMLESEFDIAGVVADGQALIETATALDPDIVVLDITMPGLNGIEAARRLKEAAPVLQQPLRAPHHQREQQHEHARE